MATIRAYTTIEQSSKWAEILPLESADMYYAYYHNPISGASYYEEYPIFHIPMNKSKSLPCWSLAALFGVLPDGTDIVKDKADTENEKYMCTVGVKDDIISTFGNNPIDACYEMILKLHELKML